MTLQANQQNRVAVEDYVNRNQLHFGRRKRKKFVLCTQFSNKFHAHFITLTVYEIFPICTQPPQYIAGNHTFQSKYIIMVSAFHPSQIYRIKKFVQNIFIRIFTILIYIQVYSARFS